MSDTMRGFLIRSLSLLWLTAAAGVTLAQPSLPANPPPPPRASDQGGTSAPGQPGQPMRMRGETPEPTADEARGAPAMQYFVALSSTVLILATVCKPSRKTQ